MFVFYPQFSALLENLCTLTLPSVLTDIQLLPNEISRQTENISELPSPEHKRTESRKKLDIWFYVNSSVTACTLNRCHKLTAPFIVHLHLGLIDKKSVLESQCNKKAYASALGNLVCKIKYQVHIRNILHQQLVI